MKKVALAVAVFFVVALGVFAYLMAVGGEYTLYMDYGNDEMYSNVSEENYSMGVEIADEGVVKLESFEQYDDHFEAKFSSVAKGTTDVRIYILPKSNVNTLDAVAVDDDITMYVGSFNQIVAKVTESFWSDDASISFNGWQSIVVGATVYFVWLAVYLFVLFKKRQKKPHSIYTYKTILLNGFFVMAVVVATMSLLITVLSFLTPSFYGMSSFIASMQSLTTVFVLLSSPLIFIFALAMTISNISLIRHEGFRIQNLLGFILSTLMLFAVYVALYTLVSYNLAFIPIEFINVYTALLTFFDCLLLSTIICAIIVSRYKPKFDKDYIIILGCGIKKDGTLMPLLRGRVDRAIRFYNDQLKATGKKAVFVPSGGKGSDEIISESEAMKRYLVEQGIPEEQILMEDKSTNTLENMQFSKKLIDERTEDARVVFSTTNYHVFRSGMFAVQAGLNADGIGSKTKWYFWPNAFIREFIGMVVSSWKYVLLAFFIIVLFSISQLIYGSPILNNLLGI